MFLICVATSTQKLLCILALDITLSQKTLIAVFLVMDMMFYGYINFVKKIDYLYLQGLYTAGQ
jgi:uncharacterized membrane protein YqhA